MQGCVTDSDVQNTNHLSVGHNTKKNVK
jgi:histone H3